MLRTDSLVGEASERSERLGMRNERRGCRLRRARLRVTLRGSFDPPANSELPRSGVCSWREGHPSEGRGRQ
eukprot:scaffold870_cov268-Pinguiococcus_pyrenoidosus.AAC.24